MQDLNDKITGGSLTAAEWNEVPSEIQNVIEGLGLALTSSDLNQLGKSIAGYAANGDFYTDSGAADSYVLTAIGSKQSPTAYTDGFSAVFRAGNTNTGASTVNVATLGVKNVFRDGSAVVAGDITIGEIVELVFSSANDRFDQVLFSKVSHSIPAASTTVQGHVELATNAEALAGTDTTRAVTPAGVATALTGAAAPAGYLRIGPEYINDEGMEEAQLDIDAALVVDTWESIGPTGSGADNTWASMDVIPAGAVAVRVRFVVATAGTVAGSHSAYVLARKTGASITPTGTVGYAGMQADGTNGHQSISVSSAIIPLDASLRFDAKWISVGVSSSQDIKANIESWFLPA